MSYTSIRIRRGNTNDWATSSTLALGELGFDTTLKVLKIGDGSSSWVNLTGLQTATGGVPGPTGPASTVPGPTGPTGVGANPSLVTTVPTGVYAMYFNTATNQINYYRSGITFTINLPAAATINIGRGFTGVTWGDGSTTVAQTHAYASAGSYTITIFGIGYTFPSHPSFTPYITNVASIDGITIMYNMFLNNAIFNQDISGWDVSNVTHMNSMFQNASAFNRNISTWNVSNVMNMDSMFQNASAFNQNISSWNVSNVTNLSFMLLNCPIRATPSYYTSIQARANAVGQSLA